MRHGSLFSGIGGFDLASEWMGWDNVFHCEWNEFGSKVLKHYWPKAISYADITKTDFTIHRGSIDILTGGFPCQPYSAAGKRLGTADDRHLWPEMLRAIREIQPMYVVGENVRGLTNWNGGLVFDQVQADLEAEGYEVLPFLLPACAVNAPHRRDRIWFVATITGSNIGGRGAVSKCEHNQIREWKICSDEQDDWNKIRGFLSDGSSNGPTPNPNHPGTGEPMRDDRIGTEENKGREGLTQPEFGEVGGDAADTGSCGLQTDHIMREPKGKKHPAGSNSETLSADTEYKGLERRDCKCGRDFDRSKEDNEEWSAVWGHSSRCHKKITPDSDSRRQSSEEHRQTESGLTSETSGRNDWQNFPTQSPICGRDDGLSSRLDGITFPKWRNESIKGYGNAIVPQVAYQIFKAISETKYF